MNNIIEEIRNLELHDVGIKSINLDFVNNSIVIYIVKHNNDIREYEESKLIFESISNVKFQDIDNFNVDEIFDCTVKKASNDSLRYEVIFILLSEGGNNSVNISFEFAAFIYKLNN